MSASLSQINVSGLIAVLVAIPFLIVSIRTVLLSKSSNQWPKVSGTIKAISDFGSDLKYRLEYEYTLNRNVYRNSRIIFSTSKTYRKRLARAFENKYVQNQIVDVYYNPKNLKQSVLEPGKNNGALFHIILLGVLIALGGLALFNEALFAQIMDALFKIFN